MKFIKNENEKMEKSKNHSLPMRWQEVVDEVK